MGKLFSLLFALLLLQQPGYAQKTGKARVDSLLDELAMAKEDTAKVNMYFSVMDAYVYYKPEEGLTYQAAALDLATKTGWKIGVAKIKDRIGRLNWRTGNFSEALKNHNEALEVYQQTNNRYARYILIEIAQDYVDDGKYAQAEPYLLTSVKLCIANNDKKSLFFAYGILRYMYGIQGNVAEATKVSYDYLKVAEEIGDKKSIYYAAVQLANNFKDIDNYPDALKYYKQGLQAIRGAGNKLAESYANIGVGDVYKLKIIFLIYKKMKNETYLFNYNSVFFIRQVTFPAWKPGFIVWRSRKDFGNYAGLSFSSIFSYYKK